MALGRVTARAGVSPDAAIAGSGAVLLDGLGTLVRLRPPAPALVGILHAEHGVEVSLEEAERAFRAEIAYYRAHHHEGHDERALAELRARCAEVLAGALSPAVARVLSLAQIADAMLRALRFEAYPEVRGVLDELRARGCKLVVVSNWDVSLRAVLEEIGLASSLDRVLTSADVGTPKPARAIFQAALELAQVRPSRALHVGDSFALDIAPALAAGIAAVFVSRSTPGSEDARTASEDARAARAAGVPVIASLSELLA